MVILWWLFILVYTAHPFVLLYAATLPLSRRPQLFIQCLLAAVALVYGLPLALTLLAASLTYAWLMTVSSRNRFLLASAVWIGIDWMSPPVEQPPAILLFPPLFWVMERRTHLFADRLRLLFTVALFSSIGITGALVLRGVKEWLFGDLVSWTRPLFLFIGGLLDKLHLEPIERSDVSLQVDNPNGQIDHLVIAAEASDGISPVWIGLFVTAVALIIIWVVRSVLSRPLVVGARPELSSATAQSRVEARQRLQASGDELLRLARELETYLPRRDEETIAEWFERHDIHEPKLARDIEAVEYGQRQAPDKAVSKMKKVLASLK